MTNQNKLQEELHKGSAYGPRIVPLAIVDVALDPVLLVKQSVPQRLIHQANLVEIFSVDCSLRRGHESIPNAKPSKIYLDVSTWVFIMNLLGNGGNEFTCKKINSQ